MVEAKNPSLKEAFVSGFVGIPEGMEAHAEFKIEGGEKPIALLGEGHDLAKLHKLLSRLAKSEAGAEDLRFIAQAGYSLGYIHQEGLSGGCQPLEHLITLSPHSDDDKNLAVLAHEIRHARQFENGANSEFGYRTIKSGIMMFRAMEADAEAGAAMACYQLAQQGDEGAWKWFAEVAPHIATPFAQKVAEEGKITNNARMAAFKGWYDNDQIKEAYEFLYEVSTLKAVMDQDLVKVMSFDEVMPASEIVKTMCETEKGNYFKEDPEFLSKGKFIDVSLSTLKFLSCYATKCENMGVTPDASISELPARPKAFKAYSATEADFAHYFGKELSEPETAGKIKFRLAKGLRLSMAAVDTEAKESKKGRKAKPKFEKVKPEDVIPLSDEWNKKLYKGEALVEGARKGQLLKVLEDFPLNMEIPKEVLGFRDNSFMENNLLHVCADKGYLRQVADAGKKYAMDIAPLVTARNQWGHTFLHIAARSSFALERSAYMLKELNLDAKPLIAAQNNDGDTFLHVAAKQRGFALSQAADFAKTLGLDLTPLIATPNKSGETMFSQAVQHDNLRPALEFCTKLNIEPQAEMFGEKNQILGAIILNQMDRLQKARKEKGEAHLSLADIPLDSPLMKKEGMLGKVLNVKGFSDNPKDIKNFWEKLPETLKKNQEEVYKKSLQKSMSNILAKTAAFAR